MFDEAERAYREASKESDFVLGLTHVSLEQEEKSQGEFQIYH